MGVARAKPKPPQGKLRIVCPRQAAPIELELTAPEGKAGSKSEVKLLAQLRSLGVPEPQTQCRFDTRRMWRLDFAWPDARLAVEVDGVVWNGVGSHQTPGGIADDCEKRNAAVIQGWRVLVYTQSMLAKERAAREIALTLLGIDGAAAAEARARGAAAERDREARRLRGIGRRGG